MRESLGQEAAGSGTRASTGSRRNARAAPRDWSAARRTPPSAPSTRARSCRACRAASAASRRSASGSRLRGELGDPAGDLLGLALLALDRRERRLRARRAAPSGSGPCRACRSTSAPRAARAPSPPPRPAAGAWPKYSRARSAKPNSSSPETSHRKFGSSSAASFCASASSADGDGSAKRSSTVAALIFRRLPEAASTCSDESLSARIVPALHWPSSSKKTCMGYTGRARQCAPLGGSDYNVRGELTRFRNLVPLWNVTQR